MSYSNELYQQVILDHNKKPRNFREIDNATHQCHGFNPLCGDDYTVFLTVGDDGIIQDISFMGSGCAISKASSSLMTHNLKGKSIDDAKIMFDEFHRMVLGEFDPESEDNHLGKLSLFKGIREFPSRIKCASLSWHSMVGALEKNEDITTE
ncbi:Fe-S cluster assembly sulfur transfer protein SufU [Nitrospina watsonii]|uniref:Iron-sulfur cluster assembly scaffold protein IscU n=1 Tax=Nitrospina watsonii TaxID=1323948 RepID=A0ABM9HCB4_9BACT|nr:SUF system NifU family Fe-S cluster assembly protein [Nitrospina watsonii]CAI2717736.1 Iron-sulfur cluster assembly scaffold protein IscU [Nitrospina watsonii]